MNWFRTASSLAKILYHYRAGKTRLGVPPIRLWIETSLVCNLRCVMCPNKEIPAADKGIMGLDLFRQIIDEAATFANDVNVHHRGEPLTNPHLPEMIHYAVDAGLKVRFHTNATLLDKELTRAIIEAEPDWVSISLDGFGKDAYEQIRRGAHFDKTVSNVLSFLETRARMGSRRPYITVERIEFADPTIAADQEEVERLASLFREKGLDEVIVKQEYTWATESASPPCDPLAGSVCTFPWYAMVICWDGTVTPCPQDYFAGMRLGNVREQSIREIWNDGPYVALRQRLLSDPQGLSLCSRCDRLTRRRVAGIPLQYAFTFLTDHLIGYGWPRRIIGSSEWREWGSECSPH
jgi:radical SAM protein with 4Fe4S-binding SPASM domain